MPGPDRTRLRSASWILERLPVISSTWTKLIPWFLAYSEFRHRAEFRHGLRKVTMLRVPRADSAHWHMRRGNPSPTCIRLRRARPPRAPSWHGPNGPATGARGDTFANEPGVVIRPRFGRLPAAAVLVILLGCNGWPRKTDIRASACQRSPFASRSRHTPIRAPVHPRQGFRRMSVISCHGQPAVPTVRSRAAEDDLGYARHKTPVPVRET